MASELKILCASQPSAFDRCAGKIAEFLGVSFTYSTPDCNGSCVGTSARPEGPGSIALAHWASLKEMTGRGDTVSAVLRPIKAILVFGWDESQDSNEFLRRLTGGAILGARANHRTSHRISVPSAPAEAKTQWAGLDFDVASGSQSVGFELSGNSEAQILILRDGEPFFVQLAFGGTQLLLLGHPEIVDLDASAAGQTSALKEFERLVPLMMFIRKHFGTQCWQAPAMRACFIIDDPLLRRRYGCLDYQQLLDSMEHSRYSACIAFIPWNYRRTDSRSAAFFKGHSDHYGICVHGCDHSDREFGSPNQSRLRGLTTKALWRMERHKLLSGLPFAPVMVFPQGLFSTAAMSVLAESQFLAAVNTTPYPVDGGEDCLTLRDLLEPAITRFSNFPLFVRRYPTNLAEFVLDLYVGKPLLMVEHHTYFRDGCIAAGDFADRLNALAGCLEWTDLNTICSMASLRRIDDRNRSHIQFYTDRFSLTADEAGLQSAMLYRRASPQEGLISAKINGSPVEVTLEGGQLKIPISLEPFGRAEVTLERNRQDIHAAIGRQRFLDTTSVMLRRHACEFRDNVLDMHPWASKMAKRSIKWLSSRR